MNNDYYSGVEHVYHFRKRVFDWRFLAAARVTWHDTRFSSEPSTPCIDGAGVLELVLELEFASSTV